MPDRLTAGSAVDRREQAELAATQFISRRDTGPWTAADDTELERWLAASPDHRAAYFRLNFVWQEAGRLKAIATSSRPDAARSERQRLPRWTTLTSRVLGGRSRPALVASILLALCAVLLVLNQRSERDSFSTVVGGLTAVPMSDGSRVILNTDSQVRISVSDDARRVELEHGEAYFEVARDPRRPFIVKAGSRRVVAVGTQFAVRYENGDLRVSVTEGAVRMEPQSEAEVLYLAAGTIAHAEEQDVFVQKKAIPEIEQHLTWRAGVLTFRNTPLGDAVAEFNRYNVRKIVIEDPAVAALELGGVFRSTDLALFVDLLERGFSLRARDEGDRIVLGPG
jgi:transmembrane sensor